MFSRERLEPEANRHRIHDSKNNIEAFFLNTNSDPDKVLVVKHISRLIAKGFAEWTPLESGAVQVRFTSGETYHLAETTVLRVA